MHIIVYHVKSTMVTYAIRYTIGGTQLLQLLFIVRYLHVPTLLSPRYHCVTNVVTCSLPLVTSLYTSAN